VTYKTLRKALDRLVDEQAIVPASRSYRMPIPPATGHGDSIALVALGDNSTDISLDWERASKQLHLLERTCARASIGVVTMPGYWVDRTMAGCDRIAGMIDDPTALSSLRGFIVWCAGLDDGFLDELFPLLARSGRPAAVLDVGMRARARAAAESNPRVVLFRPSQAQPGREVGRHLAAMGHRRIAFVHPGPMEDWARLRYESLRREIAPLGGAVTCLPFREPSWDEMPQGRLGIEKILEMFIPRDQPGMHLSQLTSRIENELGSRLADLLMRRISWQTLHPAFEKVLADPGITAIVGARDIIAADCIEYLRAKGVAVPQRISVAGFDDTDEASQLKLTSYNFNNEACVEAMLARLLHPRLHRQEKGADRHCVETSGYLVPRETTGTAR
jgi:hypothetical protein